MLLDLRHCGDGVVCMTAATKVGQITVVRRNEAHFHALKGRAEEYWQGILCPLSYLLQEGYLQEATLPVYHNWATGRVRSAQQRRAVAVEDAASCAMEAGPAAE